MYFTVGSIIPIIAISNSFFSISKLWLVAVPHAIIINFTFLDIKNLTHCLEISIIVSFDF